ncbi:hypothetical protein Leryth_002390 [Lithospermum erythrorhizon]|nr:hypothetical protein Leryth_002390 [Lithospermum erythrorhizon]
MTIHSVVIQKLLSTNAHLGRKVASNHMKIYAAGSRNAMTILDGDKTLICLRQATNFISTLAHNNGRFLFVNTNPLLDQIISQMSQLIHTKPDHSWRLGGFLTNALSPKKFRGRNKKLNLGAIHPPDCVVIFDTETKSSVIAEASKLNVPIVALLNSSVDWDTYKGLYLP